MSNSRNLLNSKFFLSLLLVMTLAISSATAAFAATGTAAATTQVVIKLKLGSGQMTVDGVASAVQPPFQKSGVTFIPLSVLTKGIGAQLQLTDNKKMTLTHNAGLQVVLTTGSKDAYVNSVQKTLPAAPVAVKGVMMVPLRAAELLGAKVAYTASTKEIVIKGPRAAAAVGGKGSIDTDAGKSKIGDSYFQWSMNYPTGLAQDYQSGTGDFISFQDVKKDYYLGISVDEAEDPLDAQEQKDRLKNYVDNETVLNVKEIALPMGKFQTMVTKDPANGFYYEYRGIQANDRFYVVMFGKKAKAASELTANAALLGSFAPKFDAGNKALKDLSKVKNGIVTYKNEDYGLTVQLPPEWKEGYTDGKISYYRGDASISFQVNSLKAGDSLEAWYKRESEALVNRIAEKYREPLEATDIQWNGVPAKLVKLASSEDGTTWMDAYSIMAVKGDYKYETYFSYERDMPKLNAADIVSKLRTGMTVNFAKVEKTFGQVPDPYDDIDQTKTVVKTSKKYGYSVTVPSEWMNTAYGTSVNVDMEREIANFYGTGINLTIAMEKGSAMEGYPEYMVKTYTSSGLLKLDSRTDVTLAGVPAVKLALSQNVASTAGGKITSYLMEKNGGIYLIQVVLNDAAATEFNQKLIDDAVASFKFNG
ncbi:stalk domain-containing protein [Cohnella sp. 56]|uniref:stalk domain-containing protein n=1 Tax=Cohnella sp. 56 TaxID=3113722 RepID=UPI0030EA8A1A